MARDVVIPTPKKDNTNTLCPYFDGHYCDFGTYKRYDFD